MSFGKFEDGRRRRDTHVECPGDRREPRAKRAPAEGVGERKGRESRED